MGQKNNKDKKNSPKIVGKQSLRFENPLYIIAASSVAGKKEGEGPFGSMFDIVEEDHMVGMETWEEAESQLMKKAAEKAIEKAGLSNSDIRYIIGGDLLGQLIGTSFGIADLGIPVLGVFGACSTMGEAMGVGSIIVDGGYADKIMAITSSHFAGAEKQFRFPLDYGNQRPYSASWTVTGSGAVIISKDKGEDKSIANDVVVSGITTGKIIDFGIKDPMNMGAAMAPAAFDTIKQNLEDMNLKPDYYDKIITGDLGDVGRNILIDMLREENYKVDKDIIMDCGVEIYDKDSQDTHAGGSGCACCAITFTSYVMKQLRQNKWKRILFVPTGALLSQVSSNLGQTIPAIAHGVVVESLG